MSSDMAQRNWVTELRRRLELSASAEDVETDLDAMRAARHRVRVEDVVSIVSAQVTDARLRTAHVGNLTPGSARIAEDAANGRSAYLYGTTGSGKSRCLVAAFRARLVLEASRLEAVETEADMASDPLEGFGLGIRFVVFDDLIRRAQSAIADGGSPASVMSPIAEARWLALDDLGTRSKFSPFVADELAALIDHRYRLSLPTIMSSNLSPKALGDLIGGNIGGDAAKWQAERVESRIHGLLRGTGLGPDGGDLWPDAQPKHVTGSDRRRAKVSP